MFQNGKDIEDFFKESVVRKDSGNKDPFEDKSRNVDSPWEFENSELDRSLNLRLPAPLYCKVSWLKEHLPNTSMQKICRLAVEKTADELIAEVKRRQRI